LPLGPRSNIHGFFEIGHPIFSFFAKPLFDTGQGFMRFQMVAIPNIVDAPIPVRFEIGRWIKSDLRKSEKGTRKKDPAEK